MSRVGSLRPPLRVAAMDGGWVLAGLIFSFFGSRGADENADGGRALDGLGWVLVVVCPLLLLVARSRPRATLLVSAVLVAVYLARDYAAGPVYLVVIAAAAVAGYALPLAQSWPPVVASGVLLVAASALHLDADSAVGTAVTVFFWVTASFTPWALAAMVRMHRVSVGRAVAERQRHDRDEERVRLAREVHDVVGHSLAVISMQAGVALHVRERRPEQSRVALEAIARASHDALAELRRTLAVLRGEDTVREPGLSDLDALVAGFVAAGQSVELVVDVPSPAPARHEAIAYRIVQESLTNTVRHAGAARTRVTVAASASCLAVEVVDDGPGVPGVSGGADGGSGSGVTGMRERARSVGGRLDAGPRSDGGWRVRAELLLGGPR